MNENENIMNEEVMEQAVEAVAEPSGINFGKIGFGILAAGAAVALGYKIYKVIKAKKEKEALAVEAAPCHEDDFDDTDIAEN